MTEAAELPRKKSFMAEIFTPRVEEDIVKAQGTFFVTRPGIRSLLAQKRTFTLKKAPSKVRRAWTPDGPSTSEAVVIAHSSCSSPPLRAPRAQDVGNAYFIESVDAKGKPSEGFPLALSSSDELRNADERRYEFDLHTAAAGVHRFRFELIAEWSAWKEELEGAIAASKKRTQRGSLVLQAFESAKAAFQSGHI